MKGETNKPKDLGMGCSLFQAAHVFGHVKQQPETSPNPIIFSFVQSGTFRLCGFSPKMANLKEGSPFSTRADLAP